MPASYEVDLFGRVADSVKSASAEAQQSDALLRSVQLALQADVAQHYYTLRELDAELSTLRILQGQVLAQADAVKASTRAASLSRTQYKEVAVNYLDVIDAERTVLQSQRAALQLAGAQAVSTVNLIRALGGGWGDAPASDTGDAVAQR